MDVKQQQQLDKLEIKITEIHAATKKTEKYMRLTFWMTIAVVVLPMVLAVIAVPYIIRTYLSAFEGLM
jgi:hypothetical protein